MIINVAIGGIVMVLANVNEGEKVTIKDLSKIDHLIKRRLLDLGIFEGTEVNVLSKMPFGGPIMIESRGNRIAIRKVDLNRIEVEYDR
jgi:ferrous iron transport protein A